MRRSTLLELSRMELHEVAHIRGCFAGELAQGVRHAVVTALPGQVARVHSICLEANYVPRIVCKFDRAGHEARLRRSEGIYQCVEQVTSRRRLPLPTVDIDVEYPFPRAAREDDVEVVYLVFHPESRVASPPAYPCLGVCEAQLPYEVIDTPLTLLCGRNRIWPIDGGISLPIAAVIISRSRCHHQRKDQPDAPKHRSPPGGLLKRSIRAHPLVANNRRTGRRFVICNTVE